ncbi:MAG TPA: cobalamin-dependent protein, partial [Catalimonadaceae bacterium]|nr:cobalamin-dependent protein [Catalimonadaceae bacterium]
MTYPSPAPYQPKFPVRIVTAASLFDGHDAAINIMRRIMQSTGAEVIHLGHNRSVQEIVNCAIQEDAQGIAITSYQGGHVEYFKYMYDLLKEQGCGHVKIFGGGGGTILPTEIEELQAYGISRIYSPDDGMSMGLQGMINDVLEKCDFPTSRLPLPVAQLVGDADEEPDFIETAVDQLENKDPRILGRLISLAENEPEMANILQARLESKIKEGHVPVLGITGTGGAGKSSLIDELVRRFLLHYEDATMALISVDPSKRKTGGALLGDRIRMNAINHPRIYMRSLATRQSNLALSRYVQDAINICKAAKYDLVIVETSGIGQSDTEIIEHSDVSLYVMTSEYGAATQLEKIDMLDFADVISINKFDKRGSEDALRDVRKQYKRNHNLWSAKDEELPIIGSVASQFNDPGVNRLFQVLVEKIETKAGKKLGAENQQYLTLPEKLGRSFIIPPDRSRYLAEIAELNRMYQDYVDEQSSIARRLYQIQGTLESLKDKRSKSAGDEQVIASLEELYTKTENELSGECRSVIQNYKYLLTK